MRRLLIVSAAIALAACGGSDSTGSSKTKLTYGGVFAGEDGTEAGNFSVTVTVEDSSGSGTFLVNGEPHTFSNVSLTSNNTSFAATGDGYGFSGSVDDSTLSGDYAGPNGGGLFTGYRQVPPATVVTYCGTHIGTRNGVPIGGAFAFAETGNSRRGVFTSVLSDPFHGYLRGGTGTAPVTLDTLTGTSIVATTGAISFSGSYAMSAGDTGSVAGARCKSSVSSPILSVIDGVIGGWDSTEKGSLSFNLSNTGLGSSGSYKYGAIAHQFTAVISGVGTKVAAFDTTLRIIVDVAGTDSTLEGNYSMGGSVAGRVAGLSRKGFTNVLYCAGNTQSGSFSVVVRSDSTMFGLFTGGTPSSTFQGTVSGKPGDNLSFMEGYPDPVTVLPSGSALAGFYTLSGSGGPDGSISGSECP